MSTSIIPIDLDALPVPIRVVKEAQKQYDIIKIYLAALVQTYNETGVMDKDFWRAMKELREWLRIIKELTLDTQQSFEQQSVDLLMELAKHDPGLRAKLGAEMARRYQEHSGPIVEVVLDAEP
jgi:hypothetical protein